MEQKTDTPHRALRPEDQLLYQPEVGAMMDCSGAVRQPACETHPGSWRKAAGAPGPWGPEGTFRLAPCLLPRPSQAERQEESGRDVTGR